MMIHWVLLQSILKRYNNNYIRFNNFDTINYSDSVASPLSLPMNGQMNGQTSEKSDQNVDVHQHTNGNTDFNNQNGNGHSEPMDISAPINGQIKMVSKRELPSPLIRSTPIIHAAADAPLCGTCEQLDTAFFNAQCPGCKEILSNPETKVSQIFAIMRQWVPQTQQCIGLLIREILRRDAHPNDRDGLTDMTMLHYACKSGSSGVGDGDAALEIVKLLVESFDADVTIRCRWTDMSAIHYAVYFDVPQVLEYLLNITDNAYIDDVCRDFDGGTPLHIAAANMCLQSTKILLNHGGNVLLKDDLSRTPLDCVPDTLVNSNLMAAETAYEISCEMKKLLEEATLACTPGEGLNIQGPVTGKVVLQALGLSLGDRVIISNAKIGILRYCGATQFATSIWAGVELDEPEGKNDGTVAGITYFRCAPKYGIFAPINKITKFDDSQMKYMKGFNSIAYRSVNFPRIDVSRVTPKVETGLSTIKSKTLQSLEVSIGDRIMMIDKRRGLIRFIGETQFAPGIWYGIELEKPIGKNDGSVHGVRYFTCKPQYGIFAPVSRISKPLNDKQNFDSDDASTDTSLSLSRSSDDISKSPPSVVKKSKPKSSPSKSQFFPSPSAASLQSNTNTWLTVGVNVFINNSIGVVRYIGPVDFADGKWLGIELRTPTGKNDGSVQNKRYFQCKPNHGILVRPKKVSVRGINGAKLLPDDESKC